MPVLLNPCASFRSVLSPHPSFVVAVHAFDDHLDAAAQNAVDIADQAVCSSAIQFFQSIGGLLSTAVMQSVLNNNVKEDITPVAAKLLPLLANATADQIPFSTSGSGSIDLGKLQRYFPTIYPEFIDAYATGVTSVFWVGLGSAAVALVASLFMQHVPLKEGIDAMAMHVEGAGPIVDGPAEVELARTNVEKHAQKQQAAGGEGAEVAGAVVSPAGHHEADKTTDVTASPIVVAADEPTPVAAAPAGSEPQVAAAGAAPVVSPASAAGTASPTVV